MAVLGSLNVLFRADTKKFKKGVSSLESSLKGLKSIALGAGAAIGAYISTQFLKSTADAIDAQAKFADRLGASFEAMQNLSLAANEAGVATNSLNTGMQRMTRRLGEAFITNAGAAKDTLEALGLRLDDLRGLRADEQFLKIGKALGNVDDQGEKLALTFKLFDTEGAALVNMFDQMKDGTDGVETSMEKLGVVISRVDAKNIETANDAVGRLQVLGQGLANIFVAKVSPALTAIANKLVALASSVDIGDLMGQGFQFAAKGVVLLGNNLGVLVKTLNIVAGSIRFVASSFNRVIGLMGEAVTSAIGDTESSMHFFFKALNEQSLKEGDAAFEQIKKGFGEFSEELNDVFVKSKGGFGDQMVNKLKTAIAAETAISAAAIEQTNKAVNSIDIAANKAIVKRETSLQKFVKSMTEAVKTPLEKFQEQFSMLQEALAEGLINNKMFGKIRDKLVGELGSLKDEVEKETAGPKSPTFAKVFDLKNVNIKAFETKGQQEMLQKQDAANGFLQSIARNTSTPQLAIAGA